MYHLLLAPVALIAYVVCAGLTKRLKGTDKPCEWDECPRVEMGRGDVVTFRCPPCQQRHMASVAAAFWPIVGAWWLCNTLVWAVLVIPLRSIYRLTGGRYE